jgi:hypothetical protein
MYETKEDCPAKEFIQSSVFPYTIGGIAGYIVFSGRYILSRAQVFLLGLAFYLFILMLELALARIRRRMNPVRLP